MSKKVINFWQDHSSNFLKMAFSHDRRESIENPDGYGKRTGDCGDTVEFFLTIFGGRIKSVSFKTNGCINTNACANTVAQLVEGKNLDDAWKITPDEIVDYLETLPDENRHCAELAAGALYLALADIQNDSRTH